MRQTGQAGSVVKLSVKRTVGSFINHSLVLSFLTLLTTVFHFGSYRILVHCVIPQKHEQSSLCKMNILTGLYSVLSYQRAACEGSVFSLSLPDWRLIVRMFRVNPPQSSSCIVKLKPSNFPLFSLLSLSVFHPLETFSFFTLCSGLHSSLSILSWPCSAAPLARG